MSSRYSEKVSAWHEALITDSMEPFQSALLLNCDPNSSDPKGLSGLHWFIIKTIINPSITRNICIYKCIEIFLSEGFRIDSQCSSGFTSLCMAYFRNIQQLSDIPSLKYVGKLTNTSFQDQPIRPNYKILMNVCDLLLRHGATLKTNNSAFSPLSYTQLYYHIYSRAQDSLLVNYQHNIELQELYKLSLLKALTPEKNYRTLLITVVKHGISFPHQSANVELSLESTVRILIQIEKCFGMEAFSCIYNLPSYHCGDHNPEIVSSLRGQELEVIGAINYFITHFTSNQGQISHGGSKFLFLTIFIAVWESFHGAHQNTSTLMHQLTQEYREHSFIHKLILLKDKWSQSDAPYTVFTSLNMRQQREMHYFSQIVSLIENELWFRVVALMANQVNDRCDELGQTPLHYAARIPDIKLIQFLLEDVGAYPYVVSSEGRYFYELIDEYNYCNSPYRYRRYSAFSQIIEIKDTQNLSRYINRVKNRMRTLKTLCAVIIARHYYQYGAFARFGSLDYFIRLHTPFYK